VRHVCSWDDLRLLVFGALRRDIGMFYSQTQWDLSSGSLSRGYLQYSAFLG